MTWRDAARDPNKNGEPGDIEALLPWYVAGTLRRRERQRIEEALRRDPELARHVELVREELVEAIHLNETLGAPVPHVADRLMAAIDAETDAARKRAPGAAAGWLTGFFANLPPRTLAVAASFAVLAIALQAFMIVDFFAKRQNLTAAQSPAGYRLAGEQHNAAFAMVRFAQAASAAEITSFLHNYQAALVDGPTDGGLYRVRIAMKNLAREELGKIVARMRHESVVAFAEPAQSAETDAAAPGQ